MRTERASDTGLYPDKSHVVPGLVHLTADKRVQGAVVHLLRGMLDVIGQIVREHVRPAMKIAGGMASEMKDACTRVDKDQRCALQASADTDTEDGIHTAFDQDSQGPARKRGSW